MQRELLAENQMIHIIFNNDAFKDYCRENDLVSPNGLDDEEFIRLSKIYGKTYNITEFEMFWNTGEIPAFCYLRHKLKDEETQS
jgi:hypothetical protein